MAVAGNLKKINRIIRHRAFVDIDMTSCNPDVLEQLKLALKPEATDRRMVCVEETDTAKGDAILSFYMWYAFTKTDSPVCVLGVRDAYGHYQHVGLKFRYNLLSMSGKRRFEFVEPDECGSAARLVDRARDLLERHPVGTVYMMVDDIGALLLLGERLEDVVGFLAFAKRQPRLSLVFGCWKHAADEPARRLAAAASYLADVRVALAPLATGFSDAATGTMTITSAAGRKDDDVSYLYKLVDSGLTLMLNSRTVR